MPSSQPSLSRDNVTASAFRAADALDLYGQASTLPSVLAVPTLLANQVQTAFEAEIERLNLALRGKLCFSARHLQSGETIAVGGCRRFPMASTFKIAIAGAALWKVDRHELKQDQLIEITPEHRDQTGDIAEGVVHPGIALSLANLIEIMLVHSNNNATDRVLECVGGAASVTSWLNRIGVGGMQVDRSVNEILNDYYGFAPGSPAMDTYLRTFASDEEKAEADGRINATFDADPRDSTTPDAMLELLCKLFSTDLLRPSSQAFLFETMTRCRTGIDRIKGLLPEGTCVAHKTGTIGGTINDAGVIALPDGAGHVAIAVYSRDSAINPYTRRERLLGEISRSVYDFFRLRHASH